MSSEIKANKISPATGTDFTLGDSGDTFTVPSGVTLTNSGTATGFGSPAYASNASATDDTVNVDASDNLQFNSGYGSTATAYGCRAWVNFNGQGTVAIRESGNVSSITDNGTGDYEANFTTAMSDVNYSWFGCCDDGAAKPPLIYEKGLNLSDRTTSKFRFYTLIGHSTYGSGNYDFSLVQISVVR
jgi:hypothetical protein